MKRVVVLFPGVGYHTDKPLLYYARKIAMANCYEIREVAYEDLPENIRGNQEKMTEAFQKAFAQVKEQLQNVDWNNYEDILFVSKSIGTAIAASYEKEIQSTVRHIYLTPVPQSFDVMREKSGAVFHGLADPWCANEICEEKCKEKNLTLYPFERANHSLETGIATVDIGYLQQVTEYMERVMTIPVKVSSHPLSNPKADANAQKLYDYLCKQFGHSMLTAQQESVWMSSSEYEMDILQDATGTLPAIRGLDFMNEDFDGVVERSKIWDEKGGIVTICWHAGINGKGYSESLSDDPDFDKLLCEDTKEYQAMTENWDRAATALVQLRDAGIPILWRPFHEFDGGWFWWGKKGGDNFIKLWRLMYERYTEKFNLTNLIWVLGYADDVKEGWYPGDEYCDIVGSDTYNNSTHLTAWKKLAAMHTGKPLAFHECGIVPTVEKFESDGILWSWFMPWHTDFLQKNDMKQLANIYHSEKIVTLDQLEWRK